MGLGLAAVPHDKGGVDAAMDYLAKGGAGESDAGVPARALA